MKKTVAVLSAFASVANGQESPQYHLPQTGILPSYVAVSGITSMGERHGGSRMGLQSYALTVPLSDPRRSGFGEWMLNVQLDLGMTVVDAEGSLDLSHETLYTASLPVTFIRPENNGNRFMLTLAPAAASDFSGTGHCFDVVGLAEYRVKRSEQFTYSVGVGGAPRFASHAFIPLFGAEWKPNEEWTVQLQYYRLTAWRHLTPRLSAGPFIGGYNHTWMVNTDRGDRILRIRSLIMGLSGEYDFSAPGQRKRVITWSLGSALTTSVQFCERNAAKDAYENHHYHLGFYFSLGADFRF